MYLSLEEVVKFSGWAFGESEIVPGSKRDTFFATEEGPHSWKPLLKHSGTQRSPTMIWGGHGEFQCIGSCGQFWGFELVD